MSGKEPDAPIWASPLRGGAAKSPATSNTPQIARARLYIRPGPPEPLQPRTAPTPSPAQLHIRPSSAKAHPVGRAIRSGRCDLAGPMLAGPSTSPRHAILIRFLGHAPRNSKSVSVHQGIVRAFAGNGAAMGAIGGRPLLGRDIWIRCRLFGLGPATGKQCCARSQDEEPDHVSC